MKRWAVIFCALLAALTLAACALPTSRTEVGGERPTLAVLGAPADAVLFVDGKAMGRADRFNGVTEILYIEEGPHTIAIQQNSRTLYQEKIFVSGGETKRVEVSGALPVQSPAGTAP